MSTKIQTCEKRKGSSLVPNSLKAFKPNLEPSSEQNPPQKIEISKLSLVFV